ncbi:MAG: DUF4091 domain-containing protein [Planctomycetia bacterium]|nr:DUF4091 domain-containing protein [Planctomycetia bacterium]
MKFIIFSSHSKKKRYSFRNELVLLLIWTFILLTGAQVLFSARTCRSDEAIQVWPVDIHQKVFDDTVPEGSVLLSDKSQDQASIQIQLAAAGNEYESAQFAIRSTHKIDDIQLSSSALLHEDGTSEISADNIQLRPVGMIPVKKNTSDADSIIVRKAPCDIPDVLYDTQSFSLQENKTQGIWVTVLVPQKTKPGKYFGTISLTKEETLLNIPIQLKVFSFELPETRNLSVTNWWFPRFIAKYHNVEMNSPEFWTLIDAYMKNMREHRQNVILLEWLPSANGLIPAKRLNDGSFEIDWSYLEKMLTLAEKNGVADRIELSHVGSVDREKHVIRLRSITVFDEKEGQAITLSADEWLEPILSQLRDYLKSTNRLDRAMIHIADEPFSEDMASWRSVSDRVHKIVPEFKLIDAIESINFTDRLDIWVPKLSHYDRWSDAYNARRGENEFWYYICCHPVGSAYPNRFMDIPGSRVRVLHWINFTDDLSGYLHWGYNYWEGDVFGAPTEKYGPGDTHIVYPGENGPLDSIRGEIQRESIEDFEYLTLLTKLTEQVKKEGGEELWWLDPKNRAMELARQIVPDLAHTELDASKIEQTRLVLAQEIEAASGVNAPRLIVQTFPKDNSVVYWGPNVIELYGITIPGAKVTIDQKEIPVNPDGTFSLNIWKKGSYTVEISATLNNQTSKTTRSFR